MAGDRADRQAGDHASKQAGRHEVTGHEASCAAVLRVAQVSRQAGDERRACEKAGRQACNRSDGDCADMRAGGLREQARGGRTSGWTRAVCTGPRGTCGEGRGASAQASRADEGGGGWAYRDAREHAVARSAETAPATVNGFTRGGGRRQRVHSLNLLLAGGSVSRVSRTASRMGKVPAERAGQGVLHVVE